jgi:hypothetical protein
MGERWRWKGGDCWFLVRFGSGTPSLYVLLCYERSGLCEVDALDPEMRDEASFLLSCPTGVRRLNISDASRSLSSPTPPGDQATTNLTCRSVLLAKACSTM